ncbi:hypothetical protein ABZ215_13465 [Amycolatopsis sp. NPDC006131]|uniref:hypothetical protein n=1 Tax=Amycolatopsis sp. NPDC006131 TaxID=3156731 RepID=UPI0033BD81AA
MSDKLTSIVRTIVPGAWATLVAWLVGLGLPDVVTGWLSGLGGRVTELVALVVVYVFVRWVEPRVPSWLAALLLGSSKAPTYNQLTVSAADVASVLDTLAAYGKSAEQQAALLRRGT